MRKTPQKRIIALLLALVLSAGAAPCALAAESLESYADLDRSAWYAPGIRYCLKHDLMNGYGQRIKLFGPDAAMTRAQFATILWRMDGEPKAGLAMQYTDVPEGIWYEEAARWALASDVMGGYTVLTFAPDDSITREQIAAILWRYAKYRAGGELPTVTDPSYEQYGDRNEVSDYAAEAMEWACALGIVAGMQDKRGDVWLMPWGKSSRAVVATMLMRFCIDFGVYD